MCCPIPGEDATATSLSLALPVVLENGGPRRGEKQRRSARPVGRKEGALALVTLLLITGANEVFSHPMLLLLLLSRFSRV